VKCSLANMFAYIVGMGWRWLVGGKSGT